MFGSTAQKIFPLTIYSVNVTKSASNCGFGHITEEIFNGTLMQISKSVNIFVFI